MYQDFFEDLDNIRPAARTLPPALVPDLCAKLPNHKEFNTGFRRLIVKLNRFFDINKASLTFYDNSTERLRVTHLMERETLKTGLTLNFPIAGSTMYQVLRQGYPVADNYPERISEGLIERKIILSRVTKSVLIIPLIVDSFRLGLLSLSSPKECAFGLFLEGVGEGIVRKFTETLGRVLESVAEMT